MSASRRASRGPRALLGVVVVAVLVLFAAPRLAGWSIVPALFDADSRELGYVVTGDGTVLHDGAGGASIQATGAGIPLAILTEDDDGYTVLTSCNTEAWVDRGSVTRASTPTGAEGMAAAVVVVDAGHGGTDTGAVGEAGLLEKEVNLDVASRLGDLLGESHDIEWETGRVGPGGDVPAVAAVVMTRNPDGAADADHRVGNRFRSGLANAVEADALVSVHHNAGAQVALASPGSEVYYSHDDPASRRLAGLVAEELLKSLSRYEVAWVGGEQVGAVSRVGPDGDDSYSLLAWSDVPAVIVEGLYLSNPPEEALAATAEFRQTYAEAVYRGLVRFLTTEDSGGPVHEPVAYNGGPAATMGECSLPGPEG